ncbi:MAG: hypothetical protein WAK93_01365 [Solirubrobacteraceae bacterium]
MTPDDLKEFFAATCGVAGALIGLLFVAISVAGERLREEEKSQVHRIRADAALTSFVNALIIGLFALLPGTPLGDTAIVVSIIGLMFVTASALSLLRVYGLRRREMRDAFFVVGLFVVFVIQLITGIALSRHPHDKRQVDTIAVLVIVCFTIGIARSWELIGGPSIGFFYEVEQLTRRRGHRGDPGP